MIGRPEIRALRDTIEQARIVLSTVPLVGRAVYARELIESAVNQANTLLAKPTVAMLARKSRTVPFKGQTPWQNVKT